MIGTVVMCVICSVVASVITTKILATHYFEIVDGYVSDMTDKTEKFIEATESKIHKL